MEDDLRTASEALSRSRERIEFPRQFIDGSDRVIDPGERAAGSQLVDVPSSASSRLDEGVHETKTESAGEGQDSAQGRNPHLRPDGRAMETEKTPVQGLTELEKEVGS